MKVVYTEEALRNLDDIDDYIRQNYPTIRKHSAFASSSSSRASPNGRRARKRWPVNPA